MIEKIKKNWFTISIVSIIAIYMILVSVQNPKFIYFAGYDDLYILNLAESFLNLDWLGLYNSVTLTKGIFSSLFIALIIFFQQIPVFYIIKNNRKYCSSNADLYFHRCQRSQLHLISKPCQRILH